MIIKHRKTTRMRTVFGTIFGSLLLGIIALTGLTDARTQNTEPEKTETKIETTQPIRISGTIVEEDGTTPVPNAEIEFMQTMDHRTGTPPTKVIRTTKADQNGKFSEKFTDREIDHIYCSVYSPKNDRAGIWSFGDLRIKPVQDGKIEISKDARLVTGTVKDENGKPVAGAAVGASGESYFGYTETDESGQFKMAFLAKVPLLQFYAVKSGVGFTYIYTEENYPWETAVPDEKRVKCPISLVLRKPQTVKVLVKNETGTPLPNCMVSISSFRFEEFPNKRMNHWFNPTNFDSSVFFPRTDENGIAVFDWMPLQSVGNSLDFEASGPNDGIALNNGQVQYYGDSQRAKWKPGNDPVEITLPQSVKLVFEFVREDGSPVSNQSAFLNWKTQSRPLSGQALNSNEKGIDEILANVGDRFELHTVGFRPNHLVASPLHNVTVDNGSSEKRFRIVMKKGTRVLGTFRNPQGKAVALPDRWSVTGAEIDSKFFSDPNNRTFGVTDLTKKTFEIYLSPGEYRFQLRRNPGDGNLITVAEKTIKITDEKEIQLDFTIDPNAVK